MLTRIQIAKSSIVWIEKRKKEWNNLITRHEKSFFMVSTCNYVKKNVDGIKQFSYLCALFYAFLWAICCLLSHEPRHNGLFWNKEEINCLLMPRCVPFSSHKLLFSLEIMMMLWTGACSSTPMWSFWTNIRQTWRFRVRQDTINDIVCDTT